MPSEPSDVVEQLNYTAAVLEVHADKFPVPEHIPAKVQAVREAATLIEQQAATIRELQAEVANLKGTDNG